MDPGRSPSAFAFWLGGQLALGLICLASLAFAPSTASCGHDDGDDRADCSNGTCECQNGGFCEFSCDAPPCHVACDPGSVCSGSCANGDCTCASGGARSPCLGLHSQLERCRN